MRAAHRAKRQHRLRRQRIGAKTIGAIQLDRPIDLGQPNPDRLAGRRRLAGGSDIQHCLDDFPVAGAAAQHAAEGVLHRRLGRRFVAGQQVGGGHQHSRRAEPALGRAVAQERVLQCIQRAVPRQPLHRDDTAAIDAGDRDQAGADLPVIHQHRAGPAIAGIAADLRSGQTERVAQHVGQALHRIGPHLDGPPIQREPDPLRRRPHAAIAPVIHQRRANHFAPILALHRGLLEIQPLRLHHLFHDVPRASHALIALQFSQRLAGVPLGRSCPDAHRKGRKDRRKSSRRTSPLQARWRCAGTGLDQGCRQA